SAAFRRQRLGMELGLRVLFQRHSPQPAPLPKREDWVESGGMPRKLKRRGQRRLMQPKGCAPVLSGLTAAVERLQPVLAFPSSQLGGLAPSAMRIYSVFGYPLPTTI